jgi:hypothetical protein
MRSRWSATRAFDAAPSGEFARVELVLLDHRIEHAAPQPLRAGPSLSSAAGGAEDPLEQVARLLLHGGGDRAVLVEAVDVAADAVVAAEERAGHQRRHHARRQAVGIVRRPDHLVDRRAAGPGGAVRAARP